MLARKDLRGLRRTIVQTISGERYIQQHNKPYLKRSGSTVVFAETGCFISCAVRDMSAVREVTRGSLGFIGVKAQHGRPQRTRTYETDVLVDCLYPPVRGWYEEL